MAAKKPSTRKPRTAKKPSDLRDIQNFIENIVSGGKPAKRGANAVVSAQLQNISSAKKKAVSKASKTGHKIAKTTVSAEKFAFGDPKKGWTDVALNSGTFLLPYGKGVKLINAGTKGIKAAKTAKVVRGTLKTAGYVGLDRGYKKTVKEVDKGIKAMRGKSKPRITSVVKSAPKSKSTVKRKAR